MPAAPPAKAADARALAEPPGVPAATTAKSAPPSCPEHKGPAAESREADGSLETARTTSERSRSPAHSAVDSRAAAPPDTEQPQHRSAESAATREHAERPNRSERPRRRERHEPEPEEGPEHHRRSRKKKEKDRARRRRRDSNSTSEEKR